MCFLSKNVAKIANSLPNFEKLTKKSKKACLCPFFRGIGRPSFLLMQFNVHSISLQRLLRSGKRRRKCRNQRRCQDR